MWIGDLGDSVIDIISKLRRARGCPFGDGYLMLGGKLVDTDAQLRQAWVSALVDAQWWSRVRGGGSSDRVWNTVLQWIKDTWDLWQLKSSIFLAAIGTNILPEGSRCASHF